ncbi:lantibiotic dehydratase [uncultured Tenacibaculum sp.]|uniref:lantibiotic dehydratase n=1 Tax=uncultured Tenacibaculum sp. TaxID=174713 RepID=UPI002621CD94|nr:lantibiotic dehydratase [uncultured Tenacibaculum sp.]
MKFLPKFIFRSPLYPVNKDYKKDDDLFSEGLYLSTPILYNEYRKCLLKQSEDTKEHKKINISLYKYQSRASSRCTPFGLFAGIGIGNWGIKNSIKLNADLKETLVRKTRLDMNVLCTITQEISKANFIKPYLRFYPNTSIYKVGNNYRYIEHYYKNNKRFHKICSVDFSSYLAFILKETAKGLTIKELVFLIVDEDVRENEALNFINELIEAQLIVSDLEPNVTGEDYFNKIIYKLNAINSKHQNESLCQLINILDRVDDLIKKSDKAIFNSIDFYKSIHEELKNVLNGVTEKNLLQTDLYKVGTHKTIDIEIQNRLKKTIQFLNKITPVISKSSFGNFIKRFQERYEDNEVPLLLALDSEIGVGYVEKDTSGVNELIEDLFIQKSNNESEIKWNLLQSHLLRLITKATKENKKIIEISENDFENVDYTEEDLPSTMAVLFKIIESNTNKIYLKGTGGSSAINILGRFASGNQELFDIISDIADFEQEQFPEKILAEIIHLPESRTGNILARPSYRKYEIPYLAKSSLDFNFQIKMEDLVVKIRRDKVILFDKRLKKEIIPRLGNAHNYSYNSLPVYHFLCDIQSQYFTKPYVGFNWGVLSNQFDFLPRVEFNNTILSAAKWYLKKKDFKALLGKEIGVEQKRSLFLEMMTKLEVPDKFLISEGDNELLIDVEKEIAIDTFLDVIKNKEEIILEEYLFNTDDFLITDTNENKYTNECIAVILNEKKSKEHIEVKRKEKEVKKQNIKQYFTLGSEWLYYKIYTGVKTSDLILTDKIKKIAIKLLEDKVIDHWFFIRYMDSESHLRIRFHISNFEKIGMILQYINNELEPLIEQNLISKILTDTYARELDRYGNNTIELAEKLFYTDSVFVVNMLSMLDLEYGKTIRWQMAIKSVDSFLDDFKFSLREKYQLIDLLSKMFFKEHGESKGLKVILDTKYRNLRSQIDVVLDKETDEEKEYYSILKLIEERSSSSQLIIDKLLLLNKEGILEKHINDLVSSFLHMNLDRLFMGRNRTNEFVVYEMLARHYKSKIARLKYKKQKEVS